MKQTALYDWHREQGAKLVDFNGWSLPVHYSGLLDEHHAVRRAAGLFDVSHMGEIVVEGPGALGGVDRLVTNDCSKLAPGQILYTVACREDGGALDDLLVYRLAEDRFLLVVNAANLDKLAAWTQKQLGGEFAVSNISDEISQLALQGPLSREILMATPLFADQAQRIAELPFYACFEMTALGEKILVSRTGYTGELGFELYLPNALATRVAESLMQVGEARGLQPAGLGARDTLRFEASYCLYGNELDESTDPFEAGLAWLVKMDKGDFIGRAALAERKGAAAARRLYGFALPERKIARRGFSLFQGESVAGQVTSGTFGPTLQRSLGLALVRRDLLKEALSVEIRGQRLPIERVKLPFYSQTALRA